jgi:hypothetical protein
MVFPRLKTNSSTAKMAQGGRIKQEPSHIYRSNGKVPETIEIPSETEHEGSVSPSVRKLKSERRLARSGARKLIFILLP